MKTFKKGNKAYPVDNSYSINLVTKKAANLAGSFDTEPTLVTIVSDPYEDNAFDTMKEFVDVEVNGETFRVLNSFTDSFNEFDHQGYLEK